MSDPGDVAVPFDLSYDAKFAINRLESTAKPRCACRAKSLGAVNHPRIDGAASCVDLHSDGNHHNLQKGEPWTDATYYQIGRKSSKPRDSLILGTSTPSGKEWDGEPDHPRRATAQPSNRRILQLTPM